MIEKSAVVEHAWRTTTPTTGRRHQCSAGPGDKGNYCRRRPCTSKWHQLKSTSTGTKAGQLKSNSTRTEAGDPSLLDCIDKEAGRDVRTDLKPSVTSIHVYPQWCTAIECWYYVLFFNFALMMTEAFSWNIGQFFPNLKLVSENSLYGFAGANWEATTSSLGLP